MAHLNDWGEQHLIVQGNHVPIQQPQGPPPVHQAAAIHLGQAGHIAHQELPINQAQGMNIPNDIPPVPHPTAAANQNHEFFHLIANMI